MPDTADVSAARVAVLMLRASVATTAVATPDKIVVAPSGLVLTLDEAVARLAATPKPTRCSAQLRENSLHVVCEPPSEGELQMMLHERDLKRNFHEGGLDTVLRAMGMTPPVPEDPGLPDVPSVLVTSSEESVTVPRSGWNTYQQQYLVNAQLLVIERMPTAAEQSRGARWVVDVGRAHVTHAVIWG